MRHLLYLPLCYFELVRFRQIYNLLSQLVEALVSVNIKIGLHDLGTRHEASVGPVNATVFTFNLIRHKNY